MKKSDFTCTVCLVWAALIFLFHFYLLRVVVNPHYDYLAIEDACRRDDFSFFSSNRDQINKPVMASRASEITYPILTAAYYGAEHVTEFLVRSGVDPQVTDSQGGNALTELLRANLDPSTNLLRLLIASGIDVNHTDADGNSPLLYAIQFGPKNVIQLLLENDADPNITNHEGFSPLHFASNCGQAELLLDHGARLDITNVFGETPLTLAKKDNPNLYALFVRKMNDDSECPIIPR